MMLGTPARTFRPEKEPPFTGNYFVAVYPPVSFWRRAEVPRLCEVLGEPGRSRDLTLYVHVPFCERKCDYCFYRSYAGRPLSDMAAYVDSLLAEVRHYARTPFLRGRRLSCVYFGGGTPSLLPPGEIRRLVEGIKLLFPWEGMREATFECAPRSVTSEVLEALAQIGVTRLSLGVQSFDDRVLSQSGRVHLRRDVLAAFSLCQAAGFENLNLDLMAGLPGETPEIFRDSLRRAIELGPASITLYPTEIPYNTKVFRDLRDERPVAEPAGWPEKRDRLEHGFEALEAAGYTVVNAYTAVQDPVRHRPVYPERMWGGGDLLGVGASSLSYLDGVHFQNRDSLLDYEETVGRGALPVERAYRLSQSEELVRAVVLGLKWGAVDRARFRDEFRQDFPPRFAEPLASLVREGWATVTPAGVRLTRAGHVRVDSLCRRFYLPRHRERERPAKRPLAGRVR